MGGGFGGSQPVVRAVAAFVGLLALGTVLLATRAGPGATVDSGEYLATADGLRHGHGLTMPYVGYDEPYPTVVDPSARIDLTVFPPLFPLAIAGASAVSGSAPLAAVRWLNGLSYAVMAALVALIVGRASRSPARAALAGALVVAPTFVYTASMAWSEPMMLTGYVATIGALGEHLRTQSRRWLVAAVALAAVTSMVRFTGLAAVLAVAVVVFVTDERSVRRRVRSFLVVAACGALPEVLWFARNTFVLGAPSEKPIAWHPPGDADVERVARTLTSWFVRDTPDRRLVVGAVVAAALVAGAFLCVRGLQRRTIDWRSVPVVCAVFGVLYGAFVLAARSTFDNNIDLSTRQLLALQAVTVIGVLTSARAWRPPMRPIVVALLALTTAAGMFRLATKTVPAFPESDRSGYTSTSWDRSAGLDVVRALPDDALVVTNAPDAVWLRTGRAPLFLPLTANLYRGGANERYGEELTALADAVADRDVVVVFFDRPTRGRMRTIDAAAVHVLGLRVERRVADATIYRPTATVTRTRR